MAFRVYFTNGIYFYSEHEVRKRKLRCRYCLFVAIGCRAQRLSPFPATPQESKRKLSCRYCLFVAIGCRAKWLSPSGSNAQESKRKLRCRSNRAIAICCRGQQPSASLLIWLGLGAPDLVLLLMAVRATHGSAHPKTENEEAAPHCSSHWLADFVHNLLFPLLQPP